MPTDESSARAKTWTASLSSSSVLIGVTCAFWACYDAAEQFLTIVH